MNRIDRLTGTILLLQSQHGLTAEQLAAHWEISVRTVYRDLAALAETGVPVVFEPERGYTLMQGYQVPPIQFTDQEAAALFVGGEVTERLADRTLREALRSALAKIRAVLPDQRRDYLSRLKRSVGVWPATSGYAFPPGGFMPIQDAVLRRRCIALRYDAAGRGAVTSRTVEPLGLLHYAGHWHLIAYCRLRGDFRDFRLDRVVGLEILAETYQGHADFSVNAFLKEAIANRELIPVTLILEKYLVERFRREMIGTPSGEEALGADRVRMRLLAYSLDGLAGWLLGFGPGLEIESPRSLQEKLRQLALSVAQKYPPARGRFPADIGLSVHSA